MRLCALWASCMREPTWPTRMAASWPRSSCGNCLSTARGRPRARHPLHHHDNRCALQWLTITGRARRWRFSPRRCLGTRGVAKAVKGCCSQRSRRCMREASPRRLPPAGPGVSHSENHLAVGDAFVTADVKVSTWQGCCAGREFRSMCSGVARGFGTGLTWSVRLFFPLLLLGVSSSYSWFFV